MKGRIFRLITGLIFALSLTVMSTTWVMAGQPIQETQPEEVVPDCRECHWDVFLRWEQSAHGKGLSCAQCHLSEEADHAREGHGAQGGAQECMGCHTTGYNADTDTWEEDVIHCTACHSPIPKDHPDEPVPTDRSDNLCGQCHIQAHFEWRTSGHGRAGVTCVTCHNQHATKLRAKDVSDTCAHCHGDRVRGFSHSEHNEQGLTCADCHLAPLEGPVGAGSAKRDHSFDVELETCTSCHEYQLHNPKETPVSQVNIKFSPPGSLDSMASNITMEVSEEPDSVDPLGLAAISGVIGLVIGMVSIPLIYPLVHRVRKDEK